MLVGGFPLTLQLVEAGLQLAAVVALAHSLLIYSHQLLLELLDLLVGGFPLTLQLVETGLQLTVVVALAHALLVYGR